MNKATNVATPTAMMIMSFRKNEHMVMMNRPVAAASAPFRNGLTSAKPSGPAE
jgi:hypothetical protein